MTRDVVLCGVCSAEQTEDVGPVCTTCAGAWQARLHGVRALLDHLQDATARLTVVDRPAIVTGGEQPEDRDPAGRLLPGTLAQVAAPADLTAMDASDAVRTAVRAAAWALVVAVAPRCEHPTCQRPGNATPCPAATRHRATGFDAHRDPAAFLADRIGALRKTPWALDAFDTTSRAIRRGWALVDHAPDSGWFAGYCDADLYDDEAGSWAQCGRALYARLDAAAVPCPACRTRHDVAVRRQQMLAAADDLLVTATEAARILTGLGRPTTSATVRGWAYRQHIQPADTTGPDPRYRLGDVRHVDTRRRYGLAPREAS